MKTYQNTFAVLTLCLVLSASASAQIASGGIYGLEQAVVANGGGNSAGGFYAVEGTSGQSAAGTNSTGAPYAVRGGFWNPLLGPTAANASVSGRVVTAAGNGIRNVRVTLAGGSLTTPRTATTSSFGYFAFDDIEVGHTYVIAVVSKRFGFATPTQAVSVMDNVSDVTFIAAWEN